MGTERHCCQDTGTSLHRYYVVESVCVNVWMAGNAFTDFPPRFKKYMITKWRLLDHF